ncbi:hypothetical protein ACLKA6_003082 [Drosophila palustris]
MQLKPFYREEDGEDEEYHPLEVDETRPARSRNVTNQSNRIIEEEEIIVISNEEMAEPPPEAYVEDCESSEAGEEGADTDTTEPRPELRSDHADRDPRRRRPHYSERRREEPPRQYRHTLYRGTVNTVDSYVGLVEVAEPASEGEEMPGGPHSTTGEANARVGHQPVDEAWWLEHQIPSPARSTTEEGERLPWIEAARSSNAPPRHTPRRRNRPEPSAASKKTAAAVLCPGNEGGNPVSGSCRVTASWKSTRRAPFRASASVSSQGWSPTPASLGPKTQYPGSHRRCHARDTAVADGHNGAGVAGREREAPQLRTPYQPRQQGGSPPTRRTNRRRNPGRCAKQRRQRRSRQGRPCPQSRPSQEVDSPWMEGLPARHNPHGTHHPAAPRRGEPLGRRVPPEQIPRRGR